MHQTPMVLFHAMQVWTFVSWANARPSEPVSSQENGFCNYSRETLIHRLQSILFTTDWKNLILYCFYMQSVFSKIICLGFNAVAVPHRAASTGSCSTVWAMKTLIGTLNQVLVQRKSLRSGTGVSFRCFRVESRMSLTALNCPNSACSTQVKRFPEMGQTQSGLFACWEKYNLE